MRDFFDAYFDYLLYERNYSPHTIAAYREDLSQFADYLDEQGKARCEAVDVDMIDAGLVRGWMMSLSMQKFSPSSINRKLSAFKSFVKYLLKEGVVEKNPLRFVAGPKKSKPLPYFIKDNDMKDVLDEGGACGDYIYVRDRLIVEMLYETGIRRSELVGIKNADIDLDGMLLKVTGKRNKQRLIPFAWRLKDMIIQYICIRDRSVVASSCFFFLRKDGQQITPSNVYYIVKKKLSKISTLTKCSPHVLRHTFATSMLNEGAEIGAVKDLLGHSSLASTSVYTHVTFEELKKMYNAHPRAKSKED